MPNLAIINSIVEEVPGARAIKTFNLSFQDRALRDSFDHIPGQCAMVSILGLGECFFAISSSPTEKDFLEVSVLKLGKVTSALHQKDVGDTLAVRGPYGNGFPVKEWEGKHLLCIGGGIGQAPLRALIKYVLANREKYGNIDILYGARSYADLGFKQEMFAMEQMEDVNVHLSIDRADNGWDRFVGFVPNNLLRVEPSPKNTIAITCGPPVMIKFVIMNLKELGFEDTQIYTTLEMRMKCGIGKCGRCNISHLYVCKDGPVFSWEQLRQIEGEM